MFNFATRPAAPLAPVAFENTPTLPQLMQVVNGNTQRVQQLHSDTATVSTPGFPSLRASLSVERPRRLRLRAKMLGPELDLGSNDEVFWFWLKSSGQPAVLFARHDQFAQSQAQQMLPIEPAWIVESLGLVTLDPGIQHEGPVRRSDGKIEVRSHIRGTSGDVIRTLVIDPSYGWILEQHITDLNHRALVSALATDHRFYPEFAVSLPHRVEIRSPAANRTFQIEVGEYYINRPIEDPQETWSLPNIMGQTPINLLSFPLGASGDGSLGAPNYNQPPPAAPTYAPRPHSPTSYSPNARTGYRPQYRGYSQTR